MSKAVAEGWITVEEAEALTGYAADYLRRLARRGSIEAHKAGGTLWLVNRDDLLAYKSEMETLGRARYSPRRRRGQEA